MVAHDTSHNVTCVFNSKKDAQQYKTGNGFFTREVLHISLLSFCINTNAFCTVNVKPAGCLTIRRKLSGAPEVKPISTENFAVQFPDNLRTRHPLLGVIRERKKRSKKHSSSKTH